MSNRRWKLGMLHVAAALLAFTTGAAAAQTPSRFVGCYRFAKPLGYSATGALEVGDSAWYMVSLGAAGKVARPWFRTQRDRDQWARRGSWHTRDDTLYIRVSDGLVGWDVALRADTGSSYRGVAQYLSDAHAVGVSPFRVDVRATRSPCARSGS